MPLESGTYISDLVSSNPSSTDTLDKADDHIRLIKSTVKATFPSVSGAVTSSHTELNLLDGVTATTAELNYVDGVTSNIQTQLDNKQPLDASLTAYAALTTAANKGIYYTGADAPATFDLTAFARTILDDADASAVRTTLGLGALATQDTVASSVPSGSVFPYAGSSAPTGYLLCYGQAVSRTTYAALFAVLGTLYGTGDGSTTFNLPDLRGRAVAGKDDMGGTAADRLTVTLSGTTTLSTAVVTGLSSTASLSVGMQVFGSTLPAGVTIASIDSATQVTLSTGTGVTAGTATLRFAIVDGATLGASGGSQSHKLLKSQLAAHQHLLVSPGGSNSSLSSTNYIDYTQNYSSNYSYTLQGSANAADRGLSSSVGGDEQHPNVQPTFVLNYIIKT